MTKQSGFPFRWISPSDGGSAAFHWRLLLSIITSHHANMYYNFLFGLNPVKYLLIQMFPHRPQTFVNRPSECGWGIQAAEQRAKWCKVTSFTAHSHGAFATDPAPAARPLQGPGVASGAGCRRAASPPALTWDLFSPTRVGSNMMTQLSAQHRRSERAKSELVPAAQPLRGKCCQSPAERLQKRPNELRLQAQHSSQPPRHRKAPPGIEQSDFSNS